jgi:hypothetical protein
MKAKSIVLIATFALAGAGCHSGHVNRSYENPSADSTDSNRLLIRMAMEENVYNAVANERTIYPKDFRAGTAELNPLGSRRIDMLIDASQGTRGYISVIRGDELAEVYSDRVATVRQALADAGVSTTDVKVIKADHVGGAGIPSDRAVLSYVKLMADYIPQGTTVTTSSPNSSGGTTSATFNNSSKGK